MIRSAVRIHPKQASQQRSRFPPLPPPPFRCSACPPACIPSPQARAHRLDVVQHRDRATGDVYLLLNGSTRFLEGYLVKQVVWDLFDELEQLPYTQIYSANQVSAVSLPIPSLPTRRCR